MTYEDFIAESRIRVNTGMRSDRTPDERVVRVTAETGGKLYDILVRGDKTIVRLENSKEVDKFANSPVSKALETKFAKAQGAVLAYLKLANEQGPWDPRGTESDAVKDAYYKMEAMFESVTEADLTLGAKRKRVTAKLQFSKGTFSEGRAAIEEHLRALGAVEFQRVSGASNPHVELHVDFPDQSKLDEFMSTHSGGGLVLEAYDEDGKTVGFKFGLRDDDNCEAAERALNKAKIKYETEEGTSTVDFYFTTKEDMQRARKVVNAAIDASKERGWISESAMLLGRLRGRMERLNEGGAPTISPAAQDLLDMGNEQLKFKKRGSILFAQMGGGKEFDDTPGFDVEFDPRSGKLTVTGEDAQWTRDKPLRTASEASERAIALIIGEQTRNEWILTATSDLSFKHNVGKFSN